MGDGVVSASTPTTPTEAEASKLRDELQALQEKYAALLLVQQQHSPFSPRQETVTSETPLNKSRSLDLLATPDLDGSQLTSGIVTPKTARVATVVVDSHGFPRPVAMKASLLSREKMRESNWLFEQDNVDHSERERALADQLHRTQRELSRYKFRVKQLEEQNHKLVTRPGAIPEKPHKTSKKSGSSEKKQSSVPGDSSAGRRRKSYIPKEALRGAEDEDSDDSAGDGTDQDLLDDRRADWQAYLETFDGEHAVLSGDEGDLGEEEDDVDDDDIHRSMSAMDGEVTVAAEHVSSEVYGSKLHLSGGPVSAIERKLSKDELLNVDNPMFKSKPRERQPVFGHDEVYGVSSVPADSLQGTESETRESGHVNHPRHQLQSLGSASNDPETFAEVSPLHRLRNNKQPLKAQLVPAKPGQSMSSLIDDDDDDDDGESASQSAMSESSASVVSSSPITSMHTGKWTNQSKPTTRFVRVSAQGDSDDEEEDEEEYADSALSVPQSQQPSSVARALVVNQLEHPEQAIFDLVYEQSFDRMQRLLSQYPKAVKITDDLHRTPLHVACETGWLPGVAALLEINASVEARDQQERTPLHTTRNPQIIKLLAAEGAPLNAQDAAGVTPLLACSREENIECVRALLGCGGDPLVSETVQQRHCLHVAALQGNYELLLLLASETRTVLDVDRPDIDGFTALHFAASGDRATGAQLKMLMLLLDKGSEVQRGTARGVTALHLLCANRKLSQMSLAEPMVELLLSCGAQPNARDADGATPLIVSVAYREWNLCRHLLECGGDLNIPCSMSSSFLQGGNGVVDVNIIASNYDKKTLEIMQKSDCTASDLMPKSPRYKLFGFIRVLPTRIPGDTRDRCMNCANPFNQSSYFVFSSGKHHCRHCLRVVCQSCSPSEVARHRVPEFVQNSCTDSSIRLCVVCYAVLIEMKDEE